MPYVLIDDDKLKEFDPEGKLQTLPDDASDKMSRLESKANELLGEKKKLQLDFDEYKLDSKKKLSDLHNSGGSGDQEAEKLQSMLDDALGKNKEWELKYNGLIEDNRTKTLKGEADRLAASLTKDTNRAKLLSKEIQGRLAFDNDSFTVLDPNGKPTVSSVEELTSQIKGDYPFLVDGSQATGGGAQGGSGGAANTLKKFSEYNGGELMQIRNESPETYDRLKKEHYGS